MCLLLQKLTEAQQESCGGTAYLNLRQQKTRLMNEIRNLTKLWNNLLSTFYEDYTQLAFSEGSYYYEYYRDIVANKYDDDFADMENKFQIKMQILNETRDVKGVIEIQRKNFHEYQKSRLDIFNKYYYSQLNYIIYDIYYITIESRMVYRAQCDPCIDFVKYSTCLTGDINALKQVLVDLKLNLKSLSGEVKRIRQVKRWVFLSNARKALSEAFNAVNRTLTTQQVKDYYRTKLVPLYEQIISARESEHNYWRSENLLATGKTILNILQFVLDKIKQPVIADSECDYIAVIRNIVNVTSTRISPYNKFPLWDLDDFAARYLRPIENITDVDLLIKILEDAFRLAKIETKSNVPEVRHVYEQNQYGNFIILAISALSGMVDQYCPGIEVIKDAGQAAWDVFDCFGQILKSYNDIPNYHLYQYINNLVGADMYDKCYSKTQNV